METRPVAAYTLAMVGAALQAAAMFYVIFRAALFTAIRSGWENIPSDWMAPWGLGHWMSGRPFTHHPLLALVWVIAALVIVSLSIYGSVLMNSSHITKVRTGSTLVLIVSIIAFPTMWGFLIGSLLMFAGSLLGLTWLPSQVSHPSQTV